MAWTQLQEIPAYDWYQPGTAAHCEELNAERERLLATRADIDRRRSALAAQDLETVDPDELTGGNIRADTIRCLQAELAYRNRLDDFLSLIPTDASLEKEAARADLERIEAKLIEWFEQGPPDLGGYNRFDRTGVNLAYTWSPEMLARHPARGAAFQRSRMSHDGYNQIVKNNRNEIELLRTKFRALQVAMTSV